MTDAGLLALARRLPQLTRLSLAESQGLTAGGLSSALALLPVLADLDLTACSGDLRDDLLVPLLTSKGSTVGGGGSPEPGSSPVTPANIQLPQGSTCPTGSPFRCRTAAAF